MRGPLIPRGLVALALVFATPSCASDGGGYVVLGVNESDRDVVIAVTSHQPESLVLPARSQATLFVSSGTPSGELRVWDVDCKPLATLPFTRSGVSVWIDPRGEVRLTDGEPGPDGVEPVPNGDNGEAALVIKSCG